MDYIDIPKSIGAGLLLHACYISVICMSFLQGYLFFFIISLLHTSHTGVHDISPKLHCPLTPYSSIDPSHIDPEEIRRIQQVQVSSAIDFNQLAEGLEIISITG